MPDTSRVQLSTVADVNPTTVTRDERVGHFSYIDIASVGSDFGGIDLAAVKTLDWSDAPSRAQRRVQGGDILISTVRPYLRSFALVPSDLDGAVASTGFAVLRPRDSADGPYLWAVARSGWFVNHVTSRQTGSNYPAVRPKDIADFELTFPEAETRAIVGRLVATADRALALSASLVAATRRLLEELVEDATSDADPVVLGTFLTDIDGGRSPRCPDRPPSEDERGVLKTSAVRPFAFDPREAKALTDSAAFHAPALVKQGDLLILRASGNRHRVGEACVVDADYPNLMMSDLLYRLHVAEDKCRAAYLGLVLHSRAVRQQVLANAVGSSTMRKLNQSLIRQLKVPALPPPAQDALIARAQTGIRALRSAEASRERLSALAQSLADELVVDPSSIASVRQPVTEVAA